MTGLDKPIYLIAYLDNWLTVEGEPHAAIAYGTPEAATKAAVDEAHKRGVHPSAFRIVKYVFSSEVIEA